MEQYTRIMLTLFYVMFSKLCPSLTRYLQFFYDCGALRAALLSLMESDNEEFCMDGMANDIHSLLLNVI